MDGIEEEFSPDQFLADFLNADLKDENTWNSFTEIIITNVEYFATVTRTDVLNFFSQFAHEVRMNLHASLAETVLVHLNLKTQFKTRDNIKDNNIFDDIYDFCQLLIAEIGQIMNYDFTRNFVKLSPKQKNLNICKTRMQGNQF